MPRADELEPGDRTRNRHTNEIVDVLHVENYANRTIIVYQTSIGHRPGRMTVPAHMEMEDCG